jgi:hypothetical protein
MMDIGDFMVWIKMPDNDRAAPPSLKTVQKNNADGVTVDENRFSPCLCSHFAAAAEDPSDRPALGQVPSG